MKLKALKKFTYRNRALIPGDPLQANPRDARILIALNRAEVYKAFPAQKPVETEEMAEPQISQEDLADLRDQYKEKYGKRPFMGWSREKLLEKLVD